MGKRSRRPSRWPKGRFLFLSELEGGGGIRRGGGARCRDLGCLFFLFRAEMPTKIMSSTFHWVSQFDSQTRDLKQGKTSYSVLIIVAQLSAPIAIAIVDPRNRKRFWRKDNAMPHCVFKVRWKLASDCDVELRFQSQKPLLMWELGGYLGLAASSRPPPPGNRSSAFGCRGVVCMVAPCVLRWCVVLVLVSRCMSVCPCCLSVTRAG